MTPYRRRRIYLILTLLLGIALVISLVLYALRQNINLFFTPSQVLTQQNLTTRVRIGGMVRAGSVHRDNIVDPLAISFIITDLKTDITVQYSGVLPDLFREGQGVVALGRLNANRVFIAEQILAKHDEKYMPPGDVNVA